MDAASDGRQSPARVTIGGGGRRVAIPLEIPENAPRSHGVGSKCLNPNTKTPHDTMSTSPRDPQSAPSPETAGAAAGQPPDSAAPHAGAALDPSVQARLADAEARATEYMDMALRARAELDNLRKRGQIELAAAHKYAIEGFAQSLLPVRDSLEMGLNTEAPSIETLREGVEATLRLLSAAFDKHHLAVIDPVGEKFDPNRHQAISMVPAGDVPANHVVTVLQKGYLINDRVLRPALVTVRAGS